jgi:hypothetical protein
LRVALPAAPERRRLVVLIPRNFDATRSAPPARAPAHAIAHQTDVTGL